MSGQLSPRQQEIKELLDQGMQAREIGEKLGISRNAVYQTIARLKKYGVLDQQYTPSGEPARAVLAHLTDGLDVQTTPSAPEVSGNGQPGAITAMLITELQRTQQECAAIANRIAKLLG